jgi:hypothetical protein
MSIAALAAVGLGINAVQAGDELHDAAVILDAKNGTI